MNHLSYKHVKVHKGKVYVFETLRDFNVWKRWFFSKNSRVYDAVPGVYRINDIVAPFVTSTNIGCMTYVGHVYINPQVHQDKDGTKFMYRVWAIPLVAGNEFELV